MNTITKILMLVVIFLTTHLNAQNSRVFYQTEDLSPDNYNFTVADRNGVPYFFAIKESDGVFSKLTYGPLDNETLSPISYNYITLPIPVDNMKFLNGLNLVGDRLDLIVQSRTSATSSEFVFIEIDLQLNTVLATITTDDIYNKGFFRARTKNQSLILYAVNESQQLIRFEKTITNNNYTTDTVPGTYATPNFLDKVSEFKIIDNEECISVSTGITSVVLTKRNTLGSYASTQLSFPLARSWDMISFQNNKLLVLSSSKIIVLNSDLSIDSEHAIDLNAFGFGSVPTISAIFIQNNELYIYSGPKQHLIKMDFSFNIVHSHRFNRNINVFDIVSFNNDKWIIGRTSDGANHVGNLMKSLIINRNFDTTPSEEYYRNITINNFDMNIGNFNKLFSPDLDIVASLKYLMNDTLRSVLFASFEMLMGKDVSDNLVGTFENYTTSTSYLPGPIFTSVPDSNLQRDKYNRSYYVTAQMIADHVGHILSFGNPNYGMPNGIRFWPANGNTANGEAQQLANFVDQNNNGIYEPHLGDFPKIYGDKCLLTIYHQMATDTFNNDLEVHRYLFSYDCDTSEVLKNTLFCNTKYINRGTDIHDVYVGSFLDYDLGYSGDDYVGSNVELGLTYVYNGDSFDETNGSQIGFNDSIPAFGQLLLMGAKLENNGLDNSYGVGLGESINGVGFGDGIIDNEYYTLETSRSYSNAVVYPYIDPNISHQFYFNLQGLYSDGTPVVYNGTPTRYELFGESDPNFYATSGVAHPNNFTEVAVGNPPGDRRMMAGSGPGYLAAGDTLNYLTAYVLSFGSNSDPQGPSVGQLFTDAQKIKDFFAGNELGCGKTFDLSNESLNNKKVEQLDFSVYPNPFGNELFVRHDFQGEVQLTIRNLNGQEVYHQATVANQEQINIELNAGVYFLELTSSKGTVVKKLVRK